MSDREPDPRRAELAAKKYLTPAEAAFMMSKDPDTINRWTKAKKNPLPTYRFPGSYQRYVLLTEVHEYARNHTTRKRQHAADR